MCYRIAGASSAATEAGKPTGASEEATAGSPPAAMPPRKDAQLGCVQPLLELLLAEAARTVSNTEQLPRGAASVRLLAPKQRASLPPGTLLTSSSAFMLAARARQQQQGAQGAAADASTAGSAGKPAAKRAPMPPAAGEAQRLAEGIASAVNAELAAAGAAFPHEVAATGGPEPLASSPSPSRAAPLGVAEGEALQAPADGEPTSSREAAAQLARGGWHVAATAANGHVNLALHVRDPHGGLQPLEPLGPDAPAGRVSRQGSETGGADGSALGAGGGGGGCAGRGQKRGSDGAERPASVSAARSEPGARGPSRPSACAVATAAEQTDHLHAACLPCLSWPPCHGRHALC
jgi:hypothetical protein